MRALVWLSLALALAAGAPESRAHDWFTDLKNPVTGKLCCYGGVNGDCQPVAEEDWWREGAAYFVRERGKVYSIPADQAMPSRDPQGRAAACILAGELRCFFVPLNG